MTKGQCEVDVRPSSIEGLGVFAQRPFRAGQRIRKICVVREITPEAPLREDLGERADHCDYPDGKVVLWGFPDRHVNHSCDPNAFVLYEEDGCYLVARRNILMEEEITCDYNINITGGTAWPCKCGAVRCRGTSLGDFFKLPQEIQLEYRPLLAGWFVRRYREKLGLPQDRQQPATSSLRRIRRIMMALALVASGWPLFLLTAQSVGGAAYSRQSDVIYGRKDGLALTMEVLTPREPNGVGVVWIVSSSGVSSRDRTFQPNFERLVSPLLQHGYFAVIHGSSPRFQVEDYIQDARRAVQFIRHQAAKYGIDEQHLAVAGASSGGYIALMIALSGHDGDKASEDAVERVSSRVQAACCFFPPTDLIKFGEQSENILDFFRQKYGVVDPSFQFFQVDKVTRLRKPIEERSEVLRILGDISPITHVTADDPPTIVIHGDEDKVVPVQQSRRLIERLKNSGVMARLVERQGRAHAWPGWESDSILIVEWFDAQLRNRH